MDESSACIGMHNLGALKFNKKHEVEKGGFGMKFHGCVVEGGREGVRVVLVVLFSLILSN